MLDRLEHDLAGDVSKLGDTDLKKMLVWKGDALISKMKLGKKRDIWNRIARDGNGGTRRRATLPGGRTKMRTS